MSEQRHWSFNDASMLRNKIFPEGFAAPESTLPSGPFHPLADWENRYDLVYCGSQDFDKNEYTYYGSLHLKATFAGDSVSFAVKSIRQTGQDFRQERQHLSASFVAGRDALFSLKPDQEWSLDMARTNRRDTATAPYSRLQERGRLKNGFIEKTDASGRWFRYAEGGSGPVVSNWALLAAVQSLPRNGGGTAFGCLQDLERFYPAHRIRFYKTIEAQFGQNKRTLHGYVQVGSGIIPQFYWIDDSGRLLIARLALGMLVYNAAPRLDQIAKEDV